MRVLVTGVERPDRVECGGRGGTAELGCARLLSRRTCGAGRGAGDRRRHGRPQPGVVEAMEFDPDVIVHAAGACRAQSLRARARLAQLDYRRRRAHARRRAGRARALRARVLRLGLQRLSTRGLALCRERSPDSRQRLRTLKLACEQATMRANLPWLILRPADVYGVNLSRPLRRRASQRPGLWERSGLALRLVKRLREHTELPAPHGLWRSPTYAGTMRSARCELIAQGCEGVYNMGGACRWDATSGWSCSRARLAAILGRARGHRCGLSAGLR